MHTRLRRLVFERVYKISHYEFSYLYMLNLLQTLLGLDKILLKLIAPATVWLFIKYDSQYVSIEQCCGARLETALG